MHLNVFFFVGFFFMFSAMNSIIFIILATCVLTTHAYINLSDCTNEMYQNNRQPNRPTPNELVSASYVFDFTLTSEQTGSSSELESTDYALVNYTISASSETYAHNIKQLQIYDLVSRSNTLISICSSDAIHHRVCTGQFMWHQEDPTHRIAAFVINSNSQNVGCTYIDF